MKILTNFLFGFLLMFMITESFKPRLADVPEQLTTRIAELKQTLDMKPNTGDSNDFSRKDGQELVYFDKTTESVADSASAQHAELTENGRTERILAADLVRALSTVAAKYGQEMVDSRYEVGRGWVIELGSGVSVTLGRTDLEQRLDRFVAVNEKLIRGKESEIESVDARYDHGIAIAWKDQ